MQTHVQLIKSNISSFDNQAYAFTHSIRFFNQCRESCIRKGCQQFKQLSCAFDFQTFFFIYFFFACESLLEMSQDACFITFLKPFFLLFVHVFSPPKLCIIAFQICGQQLLRLLSTLVRFLRNIATLRKLSRSVKLDGLVTFLCRFVRRGKKNLNRTNNCYEN